MSAVLWQRVEGAFVFAASLYIALGTGLTDGSLPWWAMVLLFFAPDLGFLGYLAGARVGALVYNALHLYGGGLVLLALGFRSYEASHLPVIGLLWLAHVGFDRMMGYGLKEPSGFSDTHLGRIGRPPA